MSIFGPRLDRPSAVGDEGRPRATSLTIAAVVVVGLAFLTFHGLGITRVATTIGFAVGVYVAGMALVRRRRIRDQVVGHLLFHGGATVLFMVFLLGWYTLPIVLGGFLLALLGLTGTWADVLTYEGIDEVMNRAPISYGALLVALAALFVLVSAATAIASHLGTLFGSPDPSTALSGFLAWVLVASLVVLLAIRVVPWRELVAPERRQEIHQQVATLKRTAAIGGIGAVGGLVLTWSAGAATVYDLVTATPGVELLLAFLSSPVVVGPLVLVAVVGSLAVVVALAATKVTETLAKGNHEQLAGIIAGVLLTVLAAFFAILFFVIAGSPAPVLQLLGFALVASLLVLIAHALALAALNTGFVPDRAAGPAMCSTGLLIAAVGAGTSGFPAPIVFGCVAGAILVWDLSTFGLALTVELGHRPDTRRLELYHGVLSVGVGIAAVVAATLLDRARRTMDPISGPWSAVALAVLGAMLLAVALSRRDR